MHRGRVLTFLFVILCSIELMCSVPIPDQENDVTDKPETLDDVNAETFPAGEELETEGDADGQGKDVGDDVVVVTTQTPVAEITVGAVNAKTEMVGGTENESGAGDAEKSEVVGVTEIKPVDVTKSDIVDIKEIETTPVPEIAPVDVTEIKPVDVTEIKPVDVTESAVAEVTEITPVVVTGSDIVEIKKIETTPVPEIAPVDVTESAVAGVTELKTVGVTESAVAGTTEIEAVAVTESDIVDTKERETTAVPVIAPVDVTESEAVAITEIKSDVITEEDPSGVTENAAAAAAAASIVTEIEPEVVVTTINTPASTAADGALISTPSVVEPRIGPIKELPASDKENTTTTTSTQTPSPHLTPDDDSHSISNFFTTKTFTPNIEPFTPELSDTTTTTTTTTTILSDETTIIAEPEEHNEPLIQAVRSKESENENSTPSPDSNSNAQVSNSNTISPSSSSAPTVPEQTTPIPFSVLQTNESVIVLPPVNFTDFEVEVFEEKRAEVGGDDDDAQDNAVNSALEKAPEAPQNANVEIANVTEESIVLMNQTATEKVPFLLDLEKADKDHGDDGSGDVDKDDYDHPHPHSDEKHHDDHKDDHGAHPHGDDKDGHHGAHHEDSPEDRENKKRTAIIVGVAVGGVALFTLAFFTSRHCRKYSRDYGKKPLTNRETIEFVPLSTSHREVYDDMEARNPNGLYRQGPKMGPPSPRMHRKNEGKFEFPEVHGKSGPKLELPKKPSGGSAHSLSDEPFLSKQRDKIKYMDDSTDDELDASPRERLLTSNGQSPDASPSKPEIRVETETPPKPNGIGSQDGGVV